MKEPLIIIDCLIQTLNTIHVSGKTDLSALLGCINALEQLKEQIQANLNNSEDKENG